MSKFFLTTPLYYVNARPHIGHAYTNIISDCLARFKRLQGRDVFFLTGTDEHGEKINVAAQSQNLAPLAFVDKVAGSFQRLWQDLDIAYDFFLRTTQDNHKKVVQQVVKILYDQGDIYKAKYRGFYCLPCESFWTPAQVKETQGVCPECKRGVEEIEEENFFFKASRYEGWLKKYLKDNPRFIKPPVRYNEVAGFLENNKLADLCISRPKKRLSWGIDFPLDNNYVIYVWFEALLNYISGSGFYFQKDKFAKWWPADVQFIGKDILRYHAVFWPIMLHALGLAPPKLIFAHGWWKVGEEKISKSRGNIVNPAQLLADIGADALRYFLLREVPIGLDGNFRWSAIAGRINSDLANDLGNLVYRTLNMAQKYFQGKVTPESCAAPEKFKAGLAQLEQDYVRLMDEVCFSAALEKVFKFIGVMNKHIEDTKPWVLWKEKKEDEIKYFLYSLLEGIRIVALYLSPVMPAAAAAINKQLGIGTFPFTLTDNKWGKYKEFSIKKESPLFPRIE